MTDKKSTKVEPVEADSTVMVSKPSLNDWNISKLFWGLLLVLVGGLALANNFGFVEVNFGNLWRLWPLLIVAAGLSVLALRNTMGRVIALILSVLTLGAVAWVMLGTYPTMTLRTSNSVVQKASDQVKQVEVSIKAGASSLQIGTVINNSVVESELQSNIATVSKVSKVIDDNQQVTLSMETRKNNGWMVGDARNVWNVNLSKDLPLTLNVDAGASSSEIDMSSAYLRKLSIKTGASSVMVKLGDKENITELSIESGVSSVVVRIPKTSGVHLKLDNGLTSNSLADLKKVSENTYESSDYSQSKKQINIVSKIGLSSFSIERY